MSEDGCARFKIEQLLEVTGHDVADSTEPDRVGRINGDAARLFILKPARAAKWPVALGETLEEVDSDSGAQFFDSIPVVPFGVQPLVFRQIRVFQIIGHRIC